MRLRQKPLKLKGIKRTKKVMGDGSIKVFLYHRATGLPLDPNDLAGSYAAAEKRAKTSTEETLLQLIRLFDGSTTFADLSEDSRREYVWKLKRVEQKWGTVPAATFNDQDDADAFAADALAWHQDLGKTSRRSADNLMSALCRVLSFAKEQRRIKIHPLATFKRLYKSDRADKTWDEELQQEFIRTARPAMKTAMILVRNTAMRAADIRKFPWSRYNGSQVQIRSQKTGKLLWIPATREDADAAGAEDLNFHDSRGTAATVLAEIGATAPEIAEALTWTVDKAQRVIDAYLARRGILAANAIARLEDHRDRIAKPKS